MTEQDRKGNQDRDADPRTADEQESPEPERPPTIREKADPSHRLDDPPKAEGNRDEAEGSSQP